MKYLQAASDRINMHLQVKEQKWKKGQARVQEHAHLGNMKSETKHWWSLFMINGQCTTPRYFAIFFKWGFQFIGMCM
jgi:hypothetical protein